MKKFKNVLIVDDDYVTTFLTKAMLEEIDIVWSSLKKVDNQLNAIY